MTQTPAAPTPSVGRIVHYRSEAGSPCLAAIITADGTYDCKTISLTQARTLLATYGNEVNSAIGHESTAQILSDLLEVPVPVNRQLYEQEPGETALVFKLNGRAPEGVVLDRATVEEIGYTLKTLHRR